MRILICFFVYVCGLLLPVALPAQEWNALAGSLAKAFGEIENVSFSSKEVFYDPISSKDYKQVGSSELRFRASRVGYHFVLRSENLKTGATSVAEEAFDGEMHQLLSGDRLTIKKGSATNGRLHDKIFLLMPFEFAEKKSPQKNPVAASHALLRLLNDRESWQAVPLELRAMPEKNEILVAFSANDPMLNLNCDTPVKMEVVFVANNLFFPISWVKSCKSTKENRLMSLECVVKESKGVDFNDKKQLIPSQIEIYRKINGYVYSKAVMNITDCVFNDPNFDSDFMIDPSRAALIDDIDQKMIITTPK